VPKRSDPDPAAVLDASTALLAELNNRVPGYYGLVAPDVTVSSMGLPVARLNSVYSARFAKGAAEARIDELMAWFDERELPFSWHLGPRDRPRDLDRRLVARGMVMSPDPMPGLVASLADLPAAELPDGGSIERVLDPAAFAQLMEVMVEGFEMPTELGPAFLRYGDLGFGPGLPIPFIGRIDGRPVATAMAVPVDRGVVILNVTTIPEFRGRGFGRALTLATMRAGAELGARIAVLQSTEMGHGVYRRLGFEPFGRYRRCVWTRG
jgi:ribosomal protein S18 acetylase RimI-like enzyme